jgi:hypothetical protein
MSEKHSEWLIGWRIKTVFVVAAIVEGALFCGLVKFAFDDWRATLNSLLSFIDTCLWSVLVVGSLYGLFCVYDLFRMRKESGNS